MTTWPWRGSRCHLGRMNGCCKHSAGRDDGRVARHAHEGRPHRGETEMAVGRRGVLQASVAAGAGLAGAPARAEKKYGPGASDTEIKIGQTIPYSGPVSAYGVQG